MSSSLSWSGGYSTDTRSRSLLHGQTTRNANWQTGSNLFHWPRSVRMHHTTKIISRQSSILVGFCPLWTLLRNFGVLGLHHYRNRHDHQGIHNGSVHISIHHRRQAQVELFGGIHTLLCGFQNNHATSGTTSSDSSTLHHRILGIGRIRLESASNLSTGRWQGLCGCHGSPANTHYLCGGIIASLVAVHYGWICHWVWMGSHGPLLSTEGGGTGTRRSHGCGQCSFWDLAHVLATVHCYFESIPRQ